MFAFQIKLNYFFFVILGLWCRHFPQHPLFAAHCMHYSSDFSWQRAGKQYLKAGLRLPADHHDDRKIVWLGAHEYSPQETRESERIRLPWRKALKCKLRLKSNGSLEGEETIRIKFSRDGTNIGKTLRRLLSEKRNYVLAIIKTTATI